ncbi:hypothetical protein HanXRQr2_Chr06g0246011 [Helianthus annuus]|uniref:Uncharacterized protein n=1 Tax=Helianthus annuus TaxID=4232 RepID=A0A9K3IR96_HELAN|nr:hypothetical protein HanXRQr2_Chr06g0246011 [Helianthus annuus]
MVPSFVQIRYRYFRYRYGYGYGDYTNPIPSPTRGNPMTIRCPLRTVRKKSLTVRKHVKISV